MNKNNDTNDRNMILAFTDDITIIRDTIGYNEHDETYENRRKHWPSR